MLKYVEIPKSSKSQSIGSSCFQNSPIEHIFIPEKSEESWKKTFESTKIKTIEFLEKIQSITIENRAFSLKKLNDVIISPSNKDYIYKNNQYLIGKTDEKSYNYDEISFTQKDIEKAITPSNIKKYQHCIPLLKYQKDRN